MAATAAACSAFLACIVVSAPMYVQRGRDELFRPLHILGRSRICVNFQPARLTTWCTWTQVLLGVAAGVVVTLLFQKVT